MLGDGSGSERFFLCILPLIYLFRSGFVLTAMVAAYQVWRDHKITSSRNSDDIENGRVGVSGDEGSTADMTRSMVSYRKGYQSFFWRNWKGFTTDSFIHSFIGSNVLLDSS